MGYDNQEHELKLVGLYIVWECYGEKGHFYDTCKSLHSSWMHFKAKNHGTKLYKLIFIER